jgi:uncharacterized membrane protein
MEQTITPFSTKAIVIALLLIVFSLATYFLNVDTNGPVKYVGFLIFLVGIVWSVMSYGKQINYNSTFGNYFAHGFKISALVTSIIIIFLIVFVIAFPDFKEKALDQTRKAMVEKNKELSEEQINKFLEMSRKFFMVGLVGLSLVFYLIAGVVASLIGAAVTKKQPNQFAGDINSIGK